MIIIATVIICFSALIRTGFQRMNHDQSRISEKDRALPGRSDEEYDPFADPTMEPPTGEVNITAKFVETGSGTEELGFDWIVTPFSLANESNSPDMPSLLDAIECDRRNMTESMQRVLNTEDKDRSNYDPVRFEAVPIVMRNPGKGYHGPTKGSYIFIMEEYSSEQAAEKRAAEYLNPGYTDRIKNPDSDEKNAKSSVRCWGVSKGKFTYLLTTHAAQFSALEALTHDLERKLTEHISG